jgi:hypothetical protein
MNRSAFFLVSLLALSACAVTRSAVPAPGLDPVPTEAVVMLAPGTLLPDNAVPIATFTPDSPALEALPDADVLVYYAAQAGQRGANHVSVHRVNGRRIVRAYYLRIPPPVLAKTPADSAEARRGSGGSSASPGTGGPVHVRGYHRRDGTYVRPHTRSRPGSRSGGRRRG